MGNDSDTDWAIVNGGWHHSLALKTDGRLFAWGYNYRGEVGDGTATRRTSPTQIGQDIGWKAVSGGLYHTVALKPDGTVNIWGEDIYGSINRNIPAPLADSGPWVSVSGGQAHTAALKADGTLWTWGYNFDSELGVSDRIDRNVPTKVGTAVNWTAVASGWNHTVALNSLGEIWAWGRNQFGQVGDGAVINRLYPVMIVETGPWTNIAAGKYHTAAIKQDGTLWTWGYNAFGQLGKDPTTLPFSQVPVQVGNDTDWLAIAAGANHTLALKQNGELWVWGHNGQGQLGNGTIASSYVPETVELPPDPDLPPGSKWVAVVGGTTHTLALASNGSLWAWGHNNNGELGINSTAYRRLTPKRVGSGTDWVSISANGSHSMARKTDGSLWSWGYNAYGQLGNGTETKSIVPVQVGSGLDWAMPASGGVHSAAVKNDGTLWTWGFNGNGQLGDGRAQHELSPTPVDTEGSIIINSGEQVTNSVSVTLTLTATDATTSVTEMQISNDGTTWTDASYGTTPSTISWILEPPEDGKKTVSVRFKDAAGNWSGVFSDTITLDVP